MENRGLMLNKYSVGTGDRFAHQAKAQLQACVNALSAGVEVVPVWNKSNREHLIIGSEPISARQAADAAVKALNWKLPYFLDADHITAATVDRFIAPCDFFTFDVADFIGQPAEAADIDAFVKRHPELLGSIEIAGVDEALDITANDLPDRAKISYRCEESRRGLPQGCQRERRRQLYSRGVDGRDGSRAESRGTTSDPGCHRR
jgi:hypothetical protein